jgi:alkanesulfonate monooxygenase SsuD/methylene tetrahydromethanopterin reductase-like flavin-dependent oxidoreductase (luciferase family)
MADGWLPTFAPRGRMPPLTEQLRLGAEAAGRSSDSVDVAAYLPALIGQQGELLLRQQLAYYVGSMGTYYAEFATQAGFGDEVEAVRRKWEAGDRAGAVRAVSEEMLARCALGADAAEARRRIAEYRDEGVGLPIASFPHGTSKEQAAATLEALAGA